MIPLFFFNLKNSCLVGLINLASWITANPFSLMWPYYISGKVGKTWNFPLLLTQLPIDPDTVY